MKAAEHTEILTPSPLRPYRPSAMARREKPEEEKKSHGMKVMVTNDERKLLEAAAKNRNLTLSAWVRFILLEEAKRTTGDE